MNDAAELKLGDDVVAVAGARGTIVDITEMSNGGRAYGVVDINGTVRYYTEAGIKHFQ